MIAKKDKKAYVLEVNSSPGTEGIESATKIPVTELVAEYAVEKKN
jgi:glutathione synthase/RimK-type ligase-like ATP-grasp enzyme